MPNSGVHACDFCGRPIRISIEQLRDGRERCPPCGEEAVDTRDELERLFCEARKFLTEEIGISLRETIRVIYCAPDEITRHTGTNFTPTPYFDMRPVGLTVFDGDGCTILIENEQPDHMVLATAVHELVHVWQFDNLDLEGIERAGQFFLVEGLALWAEIECLRSRQLAPDYCVLHESRVDLSGEGLQAIRLIAANTHPWPNVFQSLARKWFCRGQY